MAESVCKRTLSAILFMLRAETIRFLYVKC